VTSSKCIEALMPLALLAASIPNSVYAQEWAPTATQAFPVQTLPGAALIGPLAPSTSVHVVLGLQQQNGSQIQPTLLAMLTPGNPLYGTSLTLQQYVSQFGPTTAQVQAVQNYLTSMGFTQITVSANQLLIDAYAPATTVQAAFNTPLASYSVNGATVFLNTAPAQVPVPLSGA
jgi:pseudomonalisin